MYLTALFAPFLGSALAGLMGRWIGARGSGIVTITGLFTRMTFSYFIFYEVLILGSPVVISLGSWFSAHSVSVYWLLSFDALTASMMVTVSTVSFCVHFYSLGYMQADPHLPRFLSYLSLFTGSMLLLVRANDLVTLLVGWEMIGVCSYLLIGFWFHRLSRTKAAQKAMLVNRVSDTILLIGLFFCWWYLGSTDTTLIRAVRRSAEYSDLICLFLAGGALGKSAQVGLHVWLADAMEGFLSFVLLFTNIYLFLVLFCWGARFIWAKHLPLLRWARLIMEKFLFASANKANCFCNFSRNSKFSNSIGENGLNKFEIGLIVGLMLRDGSLQNNRFEKNPNSKRNRRLAMCMRRDVLYYLNWLHSDLLKNYFTKTPPYPYPKNSPTQYGVYSRRLPVFTNIYKYWYKKKKGIRIKKVPTLAYLKKHFTEVSLAHWIMNDGYWDGTVIICTESFSKKEVQRLIKLLQYKYGLKKGTKKRRERTEFLGGVRLRFSGTAENIEKLVSLVKPYMHPKMVYKFGPHRTKLNSFFHFIFIFLIFIKLID